MRGSKFNFFQSPNPNHFNIHSIEESRFQNQEDHEINQERIFYTPLRLNQQVMTSPNPFMDPHLISSHPRSRPSEDFFGDPSMEIPNYQQLQSHNRTIKEMVEFSNEECHFNHLTPLKPQKVENYPQQTTTVKKVAPPPMTPLTQSRSTERGLKRLASEAFRFVNMQKRTTYKQVAKKLIADLGEDGDIDPSVHLDQIKKKGEMNIKRRVYDALNVLIALGLLKRNGNKILGKRLDSELPISSNKLMEKEKQRYKQQQMEKELLTLKSQFDKRSEAINTKKKHAREVRHRIQKLRELVKKNASDHQMQSNLEKMTFPLIVICQNGTREELSKQEEKQQPILQQEESEEEESMKMWQQTEDDFYCHFNSKKLEIMGELDIISKWKGEQKKGRMRTERIKRKNQ